jgi:hypothetical protein
MCGDPPGDGLGAGPLLRGWFADLSEQPGQVLIGLAEQVLAAYLRADGFLQKLGRRQPPGLELFVEVIWKIHLHSRHTPNYTHMT